LAALVALGGRELWLDLFGIKSVTLRRELGPWLGPMLAFNCATLPASLGLRLAAGLQWTWLVGVAQAAVSVATLVVATICTWQQVSPVWFMGLALALPILVTGGLTVSLLRGLPRGVSYGQPPTLQELNAWWRAGLPFLVPQVAGSLRLTAPPLLLAALLGADAVTPYNLVQRLLSLIAQPQGWLLEPLWPAYADAAARGDHLWIRHTLRWSLASSVVFTIVPLLTVPWWGPAFIEWWTHYRAVAIPLGLLWSLTLWQAGLTLVQPLTYCLNGLGRMRGQTLYGPPCVVVSLAGMAWVAATQGLSLAAAPAAVVTFLVNVPCSIGDVRLAMRNWTPDHTPA
jgi:O-antigen/teichoic acid export membrane protein